jgi:hypothetical protein
MPVVNPYQGFAQLGDSLAGGNEANVAYREAQGENLGANTQRAIAEANAQFARNKALADPQLEQKLAAVNGGSPELGSALAALNRAGVNPEPEFKAIGENQATGFRGTIGNAGAAPDTRVAAAQALNPAGLANPLTDARQQLIGAQAANTAALTPANVRLANGKAALAEAQAAHPELFHPQSALNMPANPAELRALYQLGILDPATSNRASISGPAVHAAYLAAFPEDASGPEANAAAAKGGPAAPGAPPTSGAPGPGALPPLQPGGNAHAEIKQSDQQFASVKPTDPGGKIRAGNTLTAHLGALQQLHDAQTSSDMPTAQRIFTALTGQAGSDFPTMNKLASQFVGDEMESFLAQNGGTLEGRNQAQSNFNQNSIGADQLQKNIDLGRELMGGQFAALKKAYSTPAARSDTQVAGFSKRFLLDPSVLDSWEQEHGTVTRGAALPTDTAPAAPPAAATPNATPAAGLPPPQALALLKEGVPQHFANGQVWTLQAGKPVRVQ